VNVVYDTPSHTKKVFANMRRQGKDFSGKVTPLFETMLIAQQQAEVGEGSGQPNEPQHTSTSAQPFNVEPIIVPSSSQPKKTHRPRKTKRATKIFQSSGPISLVADETVTKEREDRMERAATTASSLEAEQDSGNINRTQSMATLNEPSPQGTGSVNTLGSGEDRMALNELMELCTKFSDRVLALENVKTAQDLEITSLKKRVKKLEKKKKARTPQLKRRLFKVRIESSTNKCLETHGRYDQDIDVTTASAPITTAGVSVSTAKLSTPSTTTNLIEDEDLTIAQTFIKMRNKPLKKKDQIKFDEKVAKRLVEELKAELEEEERVARQREDEANLISWDNTQAMMEADYELA
ncbi:hypothetical protein Tco_1342067, partial [Tanacetum coccineum]